MSAETAERGVDWVFRSPSPMLKIEFQGGESLLNFERIRHIVELVEKRNEAEKRDVEFVIATNLSQVTDEMLDYCCAHSILLSSSLDGPEPLHNLNRPRPGNDSYARFVRNLVRSREVLGHDRVAALMTTTERSLAIGWRHSEVEFCTFDKIITSQTWIVAATLKRLLRYPLNNVCFGKAQDGLYCCLVLPVRHDDLRSDAVWLQIS